MRRVCAWELVSVEGVMETLEEWAFPYSNAEMEQDSASGMAASDALLLGRVTYEHLAAYWPDQPGGTPMVDFLNGVPKHVVSGTLEEPLMWKNSVLIKGNVAEEIAKLKQLPGKDITVLGSGCGRGGSGTWCPPRRFGCWWGTSSLRRAGPRATWPSTCSRTWGWYCS